MYESAAICLYLCEQHPQAGLMPQAGSPQRHLFLQWLMYLTNTVQEDLMHWWHGENYIDGEACHANLKSVAERRLERMFSQINSTLGEGGPYLLGRGVQRRRLLPRHAVPVDARDAAPGNCSSAPEGLGGAGDGAAGMEGHDAGRGHQLGRRPWLNGGLTSWAKRPSCQPSVGWMTAAAIPERERGRKVRAPREYGAG